MIVIRISSLFVTREDKNEKTIEKKNKNYRLLLSLPVLFSFKQPRIFPLPRTRCEFTNHVCTCVHVASGLSNARNLSLSPLPRLRSMPSTATIYDHRASYATLPFQRRNRKRKGARDAISRCGERLGGIEVTKGNKFKWARLIVQDKRV